MANWKTALNVFTDEDLDRYGTSCAALEHVRDTRFFHMRILPFAGTHLELCERVKKVFSTLKETTSPLVLHRPDTLAIATWDSDACESKKRERKTTRKTAPSEDAMQTMQTLQRQQVTRRQTRFDAILKTIRDHLPTSYVLDEYDVVSWKRFFDDVYSATPRALKQLQQHDVDDDLKPLVVIVIGVWFYGIMRLARRASESVTKDGRRIVVAEPPGATTTFSNMIVEHCVMEAHIIVYDLMAHGDRRRLDRYRARSTAASTGPGNATDCGMQALLNRRVLEYVELQAHMMAASFYTKFSKSHAHAYSGSETIRDEMMHRLMKLELEESALHEMCVHASAL